MRITNSGESGHEENIYFLVYSIYNNRINVNLVFVKISENLAFNCDVSVIYPFTVKIYLPKRGKKFILGFNRSALGG